MANAKSIIREWKWQRYTAVLIALYTVFLVGALLIGGAPDFAQWKALFANTFFKLATLAVVLALCYHALVGVLHVWPDYVKPEGAQSALKIYSHVAVVAYAAWSIYILFGMK
jgi:succinate dehydrogenase / fumarate reductase, membrane anchor subunit